MNHSVNDILAVVLAALSAAGCVYLVLSVWAVRRVLARPVRRPAESAPVSVLKPLCGADPGLLDNLRSFCRQDHPAYQVVFGVGEEGDEAVPVVRRLMQELPAADLALIVDPARRARNLKVANLQNMLPAARHPVLVISDSDMRVAPDYLSAVTGPIAESPDCLVTCLYRGRSLGGTWSALGCLYVNHGFLPQAAVAEVIGAGAGCFGASIALRRDLLERAGGFAAIADALADDYALGAAVRRAGGRIVLSPHLVDTMVAEPSLGALVRHELRWARTIRLVAPAGFLGSAITHPVAVALCAVATGAHPAAAFGMLAAALLCRLATVRALDRTLGLPRTNLLLVPLRDVLSFAVFVASFFARRVEWRDRTFRVGRKGELVADGDGSA